MALVFRNFTVNWASKILQESHLSGAEIILPAFFKYELVPIKLRIVEPDPGIVPEGYALISVAPLTLKISINDTLDDASPLATQSTWAKDTALNEFSGTLDLNTAALSAYVGSSASVTAYIQIEVVEGTTAHILYQAQVTIKNSVTQPTTSSPDPTNTYRTAAESDGLYLKAVNGAGIQLTLISPSGNYQRIIGVDDGGAAIDEILPYP